MQLIIILWLLFPLLLVNCTTYVPPSWLENSTQSPDCGNTTWKSEDPRSESPWTALIFIRSPNENGTISFRYFTSGVLVGKTTVFTVGGGAFGAKPKASNYSHYAIAAPSTFIAAMGLKSNRFEDQDELTQISEISYILPYDDHEASNDEYHFVVYHLKTPITPSVVVREICIPRALARISTEVFIRDLAPNYDFFLGGFAQLESSSQLRPVKIPVMIESSATCRSAYAYHNGGDSDHVFCGRQGEFSNFVNGSYCHLLGSHLYLEDRALPGRAFLASLLTSTPRVGQQGTQRCNQKRINFYAGITKHLEWLTRTHDCSPNRFACRDAACIPLSKLCNGVPDCLDGEDENRLFCKAVDYCTEYVPQKRPRSRFGTSRPKSCGYRGKCLKDGDFCNGKKDCRDGSDESPFICNQRNSGAETSSGKVCDPFVPAQQGLTVSSCTTENGAPCNSAEDQMLGSQLKLQCSLGYQPKYEYPNVTIHCTSDGSWEFDKPFACVRACGRLGSGNSLPWHVSVQTRTEEGAPNLSHCSGTLIEQNFLVTTSLCEKEFLKTGAKLLISSRVGTPGALASLPQIIDNITSRDVNGQRLLIIKLNRPARRDVYQMPACYRKYFKNPLPEIGTAGLMAATPSNSTDLSSSEKVLVVPCPSGESEFFFCVNGSSLLTFGQGFFTLRENDTSGKFYLTGIAVSSPDTFSYTQPLVVVAPLNLFIDLIIQEVFEPVF